MLNLIFIPEIILSIGVMLIIFILYLGIIPDYLFKVIDQSVISIVESLSVGKI